MMTQTETFKMRISPVDRALLARLAQKLQRSESDAVRFVVREVLQAMEADEQGKINSQPAESMTA